MVARVSGADKLLFQRAASLEGRSVATFVITHAREMARRIVADQEIIELDAVQSRRFVKALLNPTSSPPSPLKKQLRPTGSASRISHGHDHKAS